jgi:peptide/nickel transport system ATP-binding protein
MFGGERRMTAVVEAEMVGRTYRTGRTDIAAVVDVSLQIEPGEIVGIAGQSGSGKSTLLRILGGIERPNSGRVRFGGADAWPRATSRRATVPSRGYVMPIFQDPVASLDARWPIWRSITEPAEVGRSGYRRAERIADSTRHLERVGLAHLSGRSIPGQLSTGQCQRVALLRALVAKPRFIIADEPTASLDVTTAAGVTRLLKEATLDGAALLVVSHNLPWLEVLVDRMFEMRAGQLSALPRHSYA